MADQVEILSPAEVTTYLTAALDRHEHARHSIHIGDCTRYPRCSTTVFHGLKGAIHTIELDHTCDDVLSKRLMLEAASGTIQFTASIVRRLLTRRARRVPRAAQMCRHERGGAVSYPSNCCCARVLLTCCC